MIISLRGTNGSGKTHLVKTILQTYTCEPESIDTKRKGNRAANYLVTLPNGDALYVVGNYDKACGGCDGIQPYDDILPRVLRLAERGHVLFEGALVSSGYGRIGVGLEPFGDDVVFAFMDTPLEKCIQRVKDRRAARGDDRPFDPKNVVQKYRAVELSIKNIRDNHKRRVVMIDHTRAADQVMELLGVPAPKKRTAKRRTLT